MEQTKKKPGRTRVRVGDYEPLRTDIRKDLRGFLDGLPGSLRENIEKAVLLLKEQSKSEERQ